ncbi:hypothetical protein CEUSTIGMA_g10357.t1 [Chlamydomonas eustigma]|uniref:Guanylate cyclase domain-containing protein n=1 Tax=Chlamydomonas eustigma TaxID=1157962 RepID=A0A250XJF2_9CHLO|nr:hypothetical protein CEUSTIGMA_g10357.t1 [Chlamydomonas eustigma]|eukprot:GAX82930.1 hypothetical protein CEUSTIGMA_g10357.t1 [Chlamydomonas eustigma]
MGIATGQLQEGQATGDCPVGRVAKVVSDAAQSGQVLMCSLTFMRVKDSAGELGSVTEEGFKIRAHHVVGWTQKVGSADPERIMWKSSGDQHSGQALLLDMGHYWLSVEAHDGSVSEGHQSSEQHGAAAAAAAGGGVSSSPTAITTCSPAADIDIRETSIEKDKSLPVFTIPIVSLGIFRSSWASPSPPQTSRHTLAEVPAPAGASAAPATAPEPAQAENSSPKTWNFGELDLFKRLSERLAITSTEHNTSSNGVGGAALLLRSNQDHLIDTNNTGHGAASSSSAHSHRQFRVYQVLAPMLLERGSFFGSKVHLPEGSWEQGAVEAFPKGQDSSLSCPLLPTVTTVFSMVEGGRHFASGHQLEAKNMVAELEALMLQISRQLSGSYFVRQQEGEFKFMFVFCSPEAALMWCLAVQESSLYLNWSPAVRKHWPSELSVEGDLLFRGPRLKMGICEGRPLSIMPDHMGRADYHGDSINLACRLMGAGAHGGQVVCKEELFLNLVMSRQLELEAVPSSPASSKMASTLRSPLTLPLEKVLGYMRVQGEKDGQRISASALAYSPSEDESGLMVAANSVTTVGGAGNSQQAAASSSSSSSIMFQAVPESAPMELVLVPQVIVDPTASTLVWREDSTALRSQISPFGLAPLLESQ